MPNKLSVCIITFNEAEDLPDCLASVAFADEIVVVDSNSTDSTIEIAKRYSAVVVSRSFDTYANQKNYAIQLAQSEWILVLDADERVSIELQSEISAAMKSNVSMWGYRIPFKHYFMGRWIRHGGQYPSYHLRLVKREYATYHGAVHEVFNIPEVKIGTMNQAIEHYSYKDLSELKRKLTSYSTAEALQVHRNVLDVAIRPVGYFIKHYILELGFLDGWPGLIWQSSFAYYQFLVAKKAVFK